MCGRSCMAVYIIDAHEGSHVCYLWGMCSQTCMHIGFNHSINKYRLYESCAISHCFQKPLQLTSEATFSKVHACCQMPPPPPPFGLVAHPPVREKRTPYPLLSLWTWIMQYSELVLLPLTIRKLKGIIFVEWSSPPFFYCMIGIILPLTTMYYYKNIRLIYGMYSVVWSTKRKGYSP